MHIPANLLDSSGALMAWKKSRLECFYEKTETDESTGCWNWTGYRNWGGYGLFWDGVRKVSSHRWSYETFVGPIPDGMTIDHICRNTSCVNPDHLRVMSAYDNWLISESLTANNLRKTVCSNGHEFSGSNLVVQGNRRRCRECRRQRSIDAYYRRRGKAADGAKRRRQPAR